MDNRPIGIFDSGLGGLTAAEALRELLPDENIIYFGDTARMPYGTKSVKALRQMALQDMDFLNSLGVKAIIAACGTVSSTAPDLLSAFPLPVFNVLDASVKAMAATEGDGPLGIIATRASIESGVFKKRISELCPDREIIALPCQSFVELIESGHHHRDDPLVRQAVALELKDMRGHGVSALLLGCTHFGYFSEAIKDYLGRNLRLVSASHCAAERLRDYLEAHDMRGQGGRESYYTSGSAREFERRSSLLLGRSVEGLVHPVRPMEVED